MKFTNKKLIIFDLDGTLIDSSDDLALAINHMLSSLNRANFSLDTIHHWVGNGAQTLVKRALSGKSEIDPNLDEVLFEKALKIFLEFYSSNLAIKTVTYPHVHATLDRLKKSRFTLAIVTNKPFDFVEPILSALALENYFELILGGDSLSKKKPDPEPLLYVCNKLNISTKQTVMVGDSKNDILAAKSANIDSIALTYGYNYGECISIYKPNAIFDNFSDILSLCIEE